MNESFATTDANGTSFDRTIKSGIKERSGANSRSLFIEYFPELAEGKRPLSATILKPRAEVYARLRSFENLPLYLEHLEKVEAVDALKARWQFTGGEAPSVGMSIVKETPDEVLIWRSEDGGGFDYRLGVELEDAPAGRGTIVRMMIAYETTAGSMASVVEKLFGKDAYTLTKKNIQRFKALCETGHVPTIEGQPSGRDEDQDHERAH